MDDLFRRAASQSGEPQIYLDARGIVLFVNDTAAALLECGAGDALGRPFVGLARLTHARPEQDDLDVIAAAYAAPGPLAIPVGSLLTTRAGNMTLVDGCLSPLRGEGRVEGLAVAVRPFSGFHKRALQQLKSGDARWLGFVEHGKACIYVKTLDGRYCHANEAFARFFGIDGALAGRIDRDVLPASVADALRAEDMRAMLDAAPRTTEQRIAVSDADVRVIVATRFTIADAGGAARLLCCMFTDVSPPREHEEQAGPQRGELARITQLSAVGEVVSAFAHELNQPLSAALTYVQTGGNLLAERPERPDALAELFAAAEAQILRAGTVIKSLRALMRKAPPRLAPVELSEAVLRGVRLARRDLEAAGIECEVRLGLPCHRVLVDGAQLEQVIVNLLRNAIDAIEAFETADPERRRIEIAVAEADDDAYVPRGSVCVAVRDSGPGIPADALGRLFDPFFTTKSNGMGFGLKVSRTIIESFGGEIAARNGPDGGAVVSFRLPIHGAA